MTTVHSLPCPSRNIMYNCEVEMWKTRSQKQDDCQMKSSQLIPDRLFLTDFKDSTKKRVRQEEKRAKAYDTRYSQAVSHLSTDRARRCLTSVIGREPVYSTWYGRRQMNFKMSGLCPNTIS